MSEQASVSLEELQDWIGREHSFAGVDAVTHSDIRRKLEVAEGVYQVVSDQASHFRTEFLEIVVVLLILIEIVVAFVH